MAGIKIGIDLGTTNSVVAAYVGVEARVVDNKESTPLTPSMVSYRKRKDEEEFLIGAPSYDFWEFDPKNTINSVKRLMGRSFSDPQVQKAKKAVQYDIVEPSDGTRDSLRVVLGGKEYSPVDISAMILRKLKEDAEYRLGGEVTHAVVTVPAYFSQIQRDATRKAVLQAGMKVIKILDEPTAAAIAYGLDSADSQEVKTILVYDLGGGTFDIALLFLSGGIFAPLNLEGNMWLGGDDFDQVLIDYAVNDIKREYGVDPTSDEKAMVKIRKAARKAKEMLSASKTADLISPGIMQDGSGNLIGLDITITQHQFVDMISPLVEKTVALVEKAIEKKFVDKSTNKPDLSKIDYVLMAGNATMTPLVQQAMEDMFGRKKVMRKHNPKLMVALGAAILASRGDWVFCPNPDPDDPSQECNHANPFDATECERCHGSLVHVEGPTPKGPAPEPPEPGDVEVPKPPEPGQVEVPKSPQIHIPGGTAPFSYGVQSAGDKFNVFVKKGDIYPTKNPQPQNFYTLLDNQVMISIPVYGGENMEKASANEKQGEAFAVLPPGLSKDTLIRITIWLDRDGIFRVDAVLDDGRVLHPWLTKGELDAKVIETMLEARKIIAEKAIDIPPEDKEGLDQQERAAWDKMDQGKFEEARDEANKLKEMAEKSGRGGGEVDLPTKAENIIRFTEFVLDQYSWAFKSQEASRLRILIEETKSAQEAGDMKLLEQKVKELDKATDELPEAVKLFLGLRGAINRRISPFNMRQAKEFSQELEEIEDRLKSGDVAAIKELNDLAGRILKAIEKFGTVNCPNCGHKVPAGERFCPQCRYDTWGMASGKAGGGPDVSVSR